PPTAGPLPAARATGQDFRVDANDHEERRQYEEEQRRIKETQRRKTLEEARRPQKVSGREYGGVPKRTENPPRAAGAEEGGEGRRRWLAYGAALAVVLVIGFAGWSWLGAGADLAGAVPSDSLLAEFNENSKAANAEYAAKRVKVAGRLLIEGADTGQL